MSSRIHSKLIFFALAFLVILILPAIYTPEAQKTEGKVLGAYTVNEQLRMQDATMDRGKLSLPFIGPIMIGPMLVQAEPSKQPLITKKTSNTLDLSAKAALVYDLDSKALIYSLNSQKKLPIASLTKLMTAVVAMEQPNFNQPITITAGDNLTTLPLLALKTGDQLMPIDLVKAMLVGSANDAAWALANHFPNREMFVMLMNEKAKSLHMDNTSFGNPAGFDDQNNFSTASDLVKLLNYAIPKLPYDQIWRENNFSFKSLSGNSYYIRNSNDLVFGHPDIKSIKTGYTPGAQESMIVQSGAGNKKVVAMVLGSQDRNAATLKLLDYIFANYQW